MPGWSAVKSRGGTCPCSLEASPPPRPRVARPAEYGPHQDRDFEAEYEFDFVADDFADDFADLAVKLDAA